MIIMYSPLINTYNQVYGFILRAVLYSYIIRPLVKLSECGP